MISAESKPLSPDRTLKLEIIDGKKAVSSTGVVDPSLFKDGEDANTLNAVMDPETCLWSFKYKRGAIPPGLRGNFTGFSAAKKYADSYFFHRNIKVTEVKELRNAFTGS